jgi:hypothetical protein
MNDNTNDFVQEAPKMALSGVCPYCEADPLIIGAREFNLGGNQAISFFCANPLCRKTINLQILAMAKPTFVDPRILQGRFYGQ